jgi:hypothetical protein
MENPFCCLHECLPNTDGQECLSDRFISFLVDLSQRHQLVSPTRFVA